MTSLHSIVTNGKTKSLIDFLGQRSRSLKIFVCNLEGTFSIGSWPNFIQLFHMARQRGLRIFNVKGQGHRLDMIKNLVYNLEGTFPSNLDHTCFSCYKWPDKEPSWFSRSKVKMLNLCIYIFWEKGLDYMLLDSIKDCGMQSSIVIVHICHKVTLATIFNGIVTKLQTYILYGKTKNPIDFQGQKSSSNPCIQPRGYFQSDLDQTSYLSIWFSGS